MSLLQRINSVNRPTDKQAYNFLVRHLKAVPIVRNNDGNAAYDAGLRPAPCDSVDELLADIGKKVKLNPAACEAFETLLATTVSLRIPGPMLWIHAVGPSSSLKTTLASIIAAAQNRCFMVSNFNGFYSGFKSANDTSLVPHVQGRVLVILDLTPLLRSDKAHQDEIFGQFRDIYDGKGNRFYNNGIQRNYDNVNFSCITCVTNIIRDFGQSDLGERFLMVEVNATWDKNGNYVPEQVNTNSEGNAFEAVLATIASGLDSAPDDIPSLDSLAPERAKCWGLINHLFEWISEESSNLADCARAIATDVEFKNQVEALSTWLEYARCPIPPKSKDLNVAPTPALPHRTIKTLTKLAICYCIVNKSIGLTPKIREMIFRRAMDSCRGKSLEIMNWLACNPGTDKETLALKMNLSGTRVAYVCDHLQTIGAIEQRLIPNNTGNRGRHKFSYFLTPKLRECANIIGLKDSKETDRPAFLNTPRPAGLRALLGGNK